VTCYAIVLTGVVAFGAVQPMRAGAINGAVVSSVKVSGLQDLSMRNQSDGYGLFASWGGRYCQDVVGRTDNGGVSFSRFVQVQRWSCDGTYPTDQLTAAGPGSLFLWGHGFFASFDGGATWDAVPHTGHVLQVVAQGSSVWIVEAVCVRGEALCPLRVAVSSDGGRTWARTASQPTGAVGNAESVAPVQGETWLVRSGTTAFVLSHGSEKYGSDTTSPIWVTSNGGSTWQRRTLTCAAGVESLVMSVAPGGKLFAVCGSGVSAGTESKSVSVSFDQGQSWRHLAACVFGNGLHLICGGYLGEVDAVSASVAYFLGWRSPLFVTRDGGTKWSRVERGIVGNLNGGPAQVFFSGSDGYVLGELDTATSPIAIWSTTDGGAQWSTTTPKTS
jgi:photosystem II stability/assembly factor-like uncharacterized protein